MRKNIILLSFILVSVVVYGISADEIITVSIFFGICTVCAIVAILFGIRRKQKTKEEKGEFIENKEIAKERPSERIANAYVKKNGIEVKITSSLGLSTFIFIIIVLILVLSIRLYLVDPLESVDTDKLLNLVCLILIILCPLAWLLEKLIGPCTIARVTGACPYCGTMLTITCGRSRIKFPYSFTCEVCRELIILKEEKFFKKDDIVI